VTISSMGHVTSCDNLTKIKNIHVTSFHVTLVGRKICHSEIYHLSSRISRYHKIKKFMNHDDVRSSLLLRRGGFLRFLDIFGGGRRYGC